MKQINAKLFSCKLDLVISFKHIICVKRAIYNQHLSIILNRLTVIRVTVYCLQLNVANSACHKEKCLLFCSEVIFYTYL